jgi:actin-like ATPase involved in cell morphogenesis
MNDITRRVSLWFDNDESLYNAAVGDAAQTVANALTVNSERSASAVRSEAAEDLATCLRHILENTQPELAGVWQDIISSALSVIDFEDIAVGFVSEVELWELRSSDERDVPTTYEDKDLALTALTALRYPESAPEGFQGFEVGQEVQVEGTVYVVVQA